jgi:hypothetical protein
VEQNSAGVILHHPDLLSRLREKHVARLGQKPTLFICQWMLRRRLGRGVIKTGAAGSRTVARDDVLEVVRTLILVGFDMMELTMAASLLLSPQAVETVNCPSSSPEAAKEGRDKD